eukprot:408564-Rhodomonas_salina.1
MAVQVEMVMRMVMPSVADGDADGGRGTAGHAAAALLPQGRGRRARRRGEGARARVRHSARLLLQRNLHAAGISAVGVCGGGRGRSTAGGVSRSCRQCRCEGGPVRRAR